MIIVPMGYNENIMNWCVSSARGIRLALENICERSPEWFFFCCYR